MSPKEKLEQGGKAIAQLVDLLALRAEALLDEWQQRYAPTGPALDDFSDLLRSPFSLELDELIEEPESSYRLPDQTENLKSSLVSEMSKDDLLELLEDSEVNSRSSDIQKLEYDESVSDWIAVVRSHSGDLGGQAELREVVLGTAMSPAMVWMALLLDGFELRKDGGFCGGDVLVG